jgi:IS30 family transposase
MRDDTQLTQEERYQIEALLKVGHPQSEIATVLKRHKSTISHEVGRNHGLRGYHPKQVQRLALVRREARAKPTYDNGKKFAYHMDRLNNRPRECLDFKIPNQLFSGIKSPVALTSSIGDSKH